MFARPPWTVRADGSTGFVFCRWDVVDGAVQATLIALHPLQGGQLDLLSRAPRPAGADQLGLAVHTRTRLPAAGVRFE